MTSSGKLLIVSTPIGGADDPTTQTVAALADADDVLCVSEEEGRILLQTAGLDIPVSTLDPELPTADVASIVSAIDAGHTIAAICRSDRTQDIDALARLVRACELQGVDVDLITSPTHELLTVLHRGSAPPGTPPSHDDMNPNEQEGQRGRDEQGRPPRRGGRRRPGGAPRQRDEQRPPQQRQRDDRPPREQRQRDDRSQRPQGRRDDRPQRPQGRTDDRPQRPQGGRRDDRPQRPQGRRDDRPQRPQGRRDDRRDRPPMQRDRDRDRGPRQRPSYDEVQPMSNETMFGYAPRKRRPEQPRSSGNPQYMDGPPRRRDHDDEDRRPARGGRGPQRPQQRRDRPQGGQGQGPQRGRKHVGGKGRPVKGRGGKPKTIGMVTKKRAEREPKGPKVYSSQMFMYKENLDERKPTERTLRTRRKKSSDDT